MLGTSWRPWWYRMQQNQAVLTLVEAPAPRAARNHEAEQPASVSAAASGSTLWGPAVGRVDRVPPPGGARGHGSPQNGTVTSRAREESKAEGQKAQAVGSP